MNEQQKYNGWKNYETWNVALFINNEEPLYRQAKLFAERFGNDPHPYTHFLHCFALHGLKTADGVRYDDRRVSRTEMDSLFRELAES